MNLCSITRGEGALVIDVPHAGTQLPADIAVRLTADARATPDTDWHVDRLYAFAAGLGATLVVATHSRYVVDLNRDPSGATLYPGADNTELCPTRTFANAPVYADGRGPDEAEIAVRRARYFDPYHAELAAEVARVRARHGHAIVLDGHSIVSVAPRFFAGRLPDLNLGTADGASCAPEVQRIAADVLATTPGFTHVVNGRFKGGYVTRHYGRPQERVHALQLEMAQACYMDEAQPRDFDAARARRLVAVLQRLVGELASWRPPAP